MRARNRPGPELLLPLAVIANSSNRLPLGLAKDRFPRGARGRSFVPPRG